MDAGVREWLSRRRPEIPPVFLAMLLDEDSGKGTWDQLGARSENLVGGFSPVRDLDHRQNLLADLTGAALSALGYATANPGRNRGAAFRLLTGDALLTYACEAALEEENPRGALKELLTVTGAGLTP